MQHEHTQKYLALDNITVSGHKISSNELLKENLLSPCMIGRRKEKSANIDTQQHAR